MGLRVLAVQGSLNQPSHTATLVDLVAAAARAHGAEVRLLDLRETRLPMYEDHVSYAEEATVQAVKESVAWAQGFILGSPEYHGSMTGAMKNFLDHHYHHLAGKCFALVAAAGGGAAVSGLNHMRASVQYCHGWCLPYHVGVPESAYDDALNVTDARALKRLERLGRDLVVYGQLLVDRWDADLTHADGDGGFAAFHQKALGKP